MKELIYKDDARRAALHNEGDAVIAAIDALPVTELPGWIPVTERLPENDDEVIVAYKCTYEPGFRVSTDCYNPRARRWDLDHQYTHWMPLPQPPEVQGMSETGTVWETTCTIDAQLPREVFDKILGNTPEEMDRMLQPGYAFDLSDGKDRAVTYIAFPEGTKPDEVLRPEDFLPFALNMEGMRADDLITHE